MTSENMSENSTNIEEELWYLNNYILLRDYYDRTISRIAARCVRKGNIAIEDYPFYGYILDILEEISEVGDYVIEHKSLHPYVEKKIAGGINALKKNLKEYKEDLMSNSSPDMIKEDTNIEIRKMKNALGGIDDKPSFDPTQGAGMNMDELMNKLVGETTKKGEDDDYIPDIKSPQDSVKRASDEPRKMIKIKKPINPMNSQAVPEKIKTEE